MVPPYEVEVEVEAAATSDESFARSSEAMARVARVQVPSAAASSAEALLLSRSPMVTEREMTYVFPAVDSSCSSRSPIASEPSLEGAAAPSWPATDAVWPSELDENESGDGEYASDAFASLLVCDERAPPRNHTTSVPVAEKLLDERSDSAPYGWIVAHSDALEPFRGADESDGE